MKRNRIKLALLLILLQVGCGKVEDQWTKDRPKPVPIQGQVLFEGKPVEGASIVFCPASREGKRYSAVGHSRLDGSFRLTTFQDQDGVVPGDYIVLVEKRNEEIIPSSEQGKGPVNKVKQLLPVKYSELEKSDLKVTIVAADQPVKLEL